MKGLFGLFIYMMLAKTVCKSVEQVFLTSTMTDYCIEEVIQKPMSGLSDDAIRVFCSNTPYEFSVPLIKAATETALRCSLSHRWTKITFNGNIVGVAMNGINGDDDISPLQHVLISPLHRRKGVGTLLLQHLLQREGDLICSVTEDVRLFYESNNFNTVFDARSMAALLGRPVPNNKDLPVFMATAAVEPSRAFQYAMRFGL